MIEVSHLSINSNFGRALLSDVNFCLSDGDKMAIIGEEGNGKTTLLKAIYDKNLITQQFTLSGSIKTDAINIGYLEQMLDVGWNDFCPSEFFVKQTPNSEPNYDIYNDFGEISKLVSKFNLKSDFLESAQPIRTLSGGEKVKMQLIKIIYKKPTLLLLDEPTNDLDIATLEMLERFINDFKYPVVFVSHDESLLENTANCILHIEQLKRKSQSKVTFSRMPYSEYIEKRKLSFEKQNQIATFEQKQRKEQIKTTKEIKDKIQKANPGRNNAMRAVLAREARWEKSKVTEHPEAEEAIKIKFADETNLNNSKIVLNFDLPILKVQDKTLASNIHLIIKGSEKIAIIGNNGCGKSSLIKEIYNYFNKEKPSGIKVGYMPQNYEDLIKSNETPLQFLCPVGDKKEMEFARIVMGGLNFTSDEMVSPFSSLSGGQKAKVYLAKMMIENNNVLLLDEPTRNLSPLSNPEIRKLLKNYTGAIISVSHDRKFISEVCDKVFVLSRTGLFER